ncbi:MAG: thermonuclease family protein, partial [Candidatus Caenarcaniphilales bacterium]|nr:thermonuclease family protein [Candidatus Caenarcaniphilales bacterium]
MKKSLFLFSLLWFNVNHSMLFLYNLDGDSFFAKPINCEKLQKAVHNNKLSCAKVEIRLVGIDAPEYSQAPWGQKAKEFFASQLKREQEFELELANPSIDKYGRLLAFVFKKENKKKTLINNELLRNGFAEIYTLGSYHPYLSKFKASEKYSKSKHLNIWQERGGLAMSPS